MPVLEFILKFDRVSDLSRDRDAMPPYRDVPESVFPRAQLVMGVS